MSLVFVVIAIVAAAAGIVFSFAGERPSDHIKWCAFGVGSAGAVCTIISGFPYLDGDKQNAQYWLVGGLVVLVVSFGINRLGALYEAKVPQIEPMDSFFP